MSRMSLDPRTRLWLYVVATAATIATVTPLSLAVLLVSAMIVVIALRAFTRWLKALRLLVPMLVILTAISAFPTPTVDSLAPALKLLALGTLSTALLAAVSMDELGDALTLLHCPPAVSFILIGGLRYAPALTEGWTDLLDARRARGATIPRGLRAVPAYASLAVPAVVRALRTADEMAEAMESRGFGAARSTPMASYRLRAVDWLLIVLSLAATVLYLTRLR